MTANLLKFESKEIHFVAGKHSQQGVRICMLMEPTKETLKDIGIRADGDIILTNGL